MKLCNSIEKAVPFLDEVGDPLLQEASRIDDTLAKLYAAEAEVARCKRDLKESRDSLLAAVKRNYVDSEIETADVMCNRLAKVEMTVKSEPKTIDLTPSWGEWGNVYRRFAESGEVAAIRHLAPDFARAMSACQALQDIMPSLTDEQQDVVSKMLTRELGKQGF